MLLEEGAVITALESLQAEDFYLESHRMIFEAMGSLYAEHQPVDLVTVLDRLTMRGTLAAAGGMEYLTNLSRLVPVAANVEQYVAIVEDRSLLRGVIRAGSNMVGSGFAADRPAEEVVSDAHNEVYALSTRRQSDSLLPIRGALIDAYNRVSEAMKTGGGITGVPTGFPDLDKTTGGFEKGQLIVLASRPGCGKTSFALNIALNVAKKAHKPVAIFSLEMSADDLALRMMCSEAGVDLGAARSGRLTEAEFAKLVEPMRTISQAAPIYVDASGSATVTQIRSRCMRCSAKEPLGLVIIDYLQLMTSNSRGRQENRMQEVSELTRSLKLLARDIGAPIMILSQLNRDIERRTGQARRPMLADLRESGSIEQDADIVMFLMHQRDLLVRDKDMTDEEFEEMITNEAWAVVAKNRNGPTADVPLLWLSESTKFVSASDRRE
ncbi:MAG: replicative DNA helicase [Clostridia bacterium]|nr:replicative DNA helicase [Clostridia bacterium]